MTTTVSRRPSRMRARWSAAHEGANVEYEYSDNLEFKAAVQLFAGKSDTQSGRWRMNDLVRLGVVWDF